MDSIYFDSLHTYLLHSPEWSDNLSAFVSTHCKNFGNTSGASPVKEYNHEHYEIYQKFVTLSENILNDMLSNLGGTIHDLEVFLDLNFTPSSSSKGPKEEMRRELVEVLLVYDSFPHFCDMMKEKAERLRYYDTAEGKDGMNGGYSDDPSAPAFSDHDDKEEDNAYLIAVNNLVAMGFNEHSSHSALSLHSNNFDLALQHLFDHPPPSPRAKPIERLQGQGQRPPLPIAPSKKTIEMNRIFDIASDIEVKPDSSSSPSAASNNANKTLITFANQSVKLHRSIKQHYSKTGQMISYDQLPKALKADVDAMLTSYTAIANKRDVDDVIDISEQRRRRHSLDPTEPLPKQQAQAQLTPTEKQNNANMTESEINMDCMFKRRDALSKEIVAQRTQVQEFSKTFTARPPISDDNLEELYLYLKDLVHSGKDLSKHKKNIHEYVFERIESSQQGVIGVLLGLMVLENEDFLLMKRIGRELAGDFTNDDGDGDGEGEPMVNGTTPNSNADDKSKDDGSNFTAELDELHRKNSLELREAKLRMEDEAKRQKAKLKANLLARRKAKKSSIDTTDDEENEDEDETILQSKEAELNEMNALISSGLRKYQIAEIEEMTRLNRSLTDAEKEGLMNDMAQELRDQHFKDLDRLRGEMHLERERQRNTIQERLRKRRMAILKSEDDNNEGDISELDAEEQQSLFDLDAKFDKEILSMTGTGVEWLSASCLGVRLRKRKGPDGSEEDCSSELASLHERNCKSLKDMEQALLGEKSRQRSILQNRLQGLRQNKLLAAVKRGASPDDLEGIENGCMEFELQRRAELNVKFGRSMLEVEETATAEQDSGIMKKFLMRGGSVNGNEETDDVDYSDVVRRLRENEAIDRENLGDALVSEKSRQLVLLRKKLEARKSAAKSKLKAAGIKGSDADQLIREYEENELDEFKREWVLREYMENESERGVRRVIASRGGTNLGSMEFSTKKLLIVEESENNEAHKEEEEEKKTNELHTPAPFLQHKKNMNGSSGQYNVSNYDDEMEGIKSKHSSATVDLVETLKDNRRKSNKLLQEKLTKKKQQRLNDLEAERTANNFLEEDWEEELEKVERELEEDAVRERMQGDRMLTMHEHKAIEEYEKGVDSGNDNVNTYDLLDEIQLEFKDDKEELQRMINEIKSLKSEKKRKKKKKKRDKKKKDKSDEQHLQTSAAAAAEDWYDENPEDIVNVEMEKIKKSHVESRQTLEFMMDMEQARQKEALQKRLMKKRQEKRRMSVEGNLASSFPPIRGQTENDV